jgi:hypothetical protein
MKFVYEFTNKRKLTKREFIQWFQKKFLYTLRKFKMIKKGDKVGYVSSNNVRFVVLKDLLEMFSEKAPIELVKVCEKTKNPDLKVDKFASVLSSDSVAFLMTHRLIKSKPFKLKNLAPVQGKIINPLYLFLDKEIELYAKLKGLKYTKTKIPKSMKQDKIYQFLEELEKKHPELKHSIVKTYLELF